jgi:hypothetical protein
MGSISPHSGVAHSCEHQFDGSRHDQALGNTVELGARRRPEPISMTPLVPRTGGFFATVPRWGWFLPGALMAKRQTRLGSGDETNLCVSHEGPLTLFLPFCFTLFELDDDFQTVTSHHRHWFYVQAHTRYLWPISPPHHQTLEAHQKQLIPPPSPEVRFRFAWLYWITGDAAYTGKRGTSVFAGCGDAFQLM